MKGLSSIMTVTRFRSDRYHKDVSEDAQQPSHEIQSLTSTQTTKLHNRVALAISTILVLVCVVAYPYAAVGGLIEPAFAATFTVLTAFAALMTAYLLFGQFRGAHLPSLAVLGSIYLYVGLINVPYLLTLPRVFGNAGLFNAGSYAPNWLWIFWQIGYPVGILLYVLVDRRSHRIQLSHRAANRLLLLLLITVPLLVVLCSIIAIDPYHILPDILMRPPPPIFTPGIDILIMSCNGLMCMGALLFLRNSHVLHLWLRVSTLASFINVSLTLFTEGRYSIGWYAARINGLLAAVFVLCALLYEVNRLYTRLALHNEELARQNRIQSDFLSVVGHEFRTALTAILGFSEMMRESDLDTQDVQEYANDIYSDATRLTRLITNLLDLERMKSGRVEMTWEQVEINALIQEIVSRIDSTSHVDRLHVNLDPYMPPICADRDKLTQVFTNLLNNALKYSPEGGMILIESKREGNTIHFFIQDHGIGIPPEKLERIFERYARVESSATRYIGGTGLGLAIVRQIVEMHHGTVWAESIIGKGSTFHVVLPLEAMQTGYKQS